MQYIIKSLFSRYTPCKAFRLMMNEINDLAGQHEVVAENLGASVIRDLTLLTKELKEERKVYNIYIYFPFILSSDQS